MTSLTDTSPQTEARGLEFIGLIAALWAIIAFSIDAMLPAFGVMAADLTPDAPEAVALVIPAFALGLGLGTLVAGPLADSWGRRPVIMGGLVLFALAAGLGAFSGSLTMLLVSRVLMGVAAAGPRVASMALVRDKVAGAEMARVMSFVMTIFMIVPAVAPWLGSVIIAVADWRAVFWSFAAVGMLSLTWFALRQPETLAVADRRPVHIISLIRGTGEVLREPQAVRSMLAQTAFMGALFGTLSSIQPLFAQSFGREASFPAWFALIAFVSAGAGLTNALLVRRFGPRRMAVGVLTLLVALTVVFLALTWVGTWDEGLRFGLTFAWI
jgi:MFS transporter, DHA1 family, multidrug resistance protein